ncbi:hypothetical protein CFP56_032894 [Quercus suber]|uniref:Uncharacterized protein n=1 Tax=Quercus suber TaxID=58331 RepID=A0AAW0LU62_QUESU
MGICVSDQYTINDARFQLNLVINSQDNTLRWKPTTVQATRQSWPYNFPNSQLLPLQLRFHACLLMLMYLKCLNMKSFN